MENVDVMTKGKAKSVIINAEIHGELKNFCKGKSLKIGGVIEDLITLYLKDHKTIQKLIDTTKDSK